MNIDSKSYLGSLRVCDALPVVSSFTNIMHLFLKAKEVISPTSDEKKTLYTRFLTQSSSISFLLKAIPVIGQAFNLITHFYEHYKISKITKDCGYRPSLSVMTRDMVHSFISKNLTHKQAQILCDHPEEYLNHEDQELAEKIIEYMIQGQEHEHAMDFAVKLQQLGFNMDKILGLFQKQVEAHLFSGDGGGALPICAYYSNMISYLNTQIKRPLAACPQSTQQEKTDPSHKLKDSKVYHPKSSVAHLKQWDQIPVVSTFTNLGHIFMKAKEALIPTPQENETFYTRYVNKTSLGCLLVTALPFVGQIFNFIGQSFEDSKITRMNPEKAQTISLSYLSPKMIAQFIINSFENGQFEELFENEEIKDYMDKNIADAVIKHLTDTYRFEDLLTYCKYIGSENLSEKTLAAFKSSRIYFYDKSGREIPLSQIPFEVREYESD